MSRLPIAYRLALRDGIVNHLMLTRHVMYGHLVYSAQVDWGKSILDAYCKSQDTSMVLHSARSSVGTASTKAIAASKAISESMERWAFFSLSSTRSTACFHLNRSTTGLAASPRLTPWSPRGNALMEASERWALIYWWKGLIGHSDLFLPNRLIESGVKGFLIDVPMKNVFVSLLYKKVGSGLVFGFSAAESVASSVLASSVELFRNEKMSKKHHEGIDMSKAHIYEKRLLHFYSNPDLFLRRVNDVRSNLSIREPVLIVDTELKGPWTRYARVRRCLFEGTNDDKKNLDLFQF